MHDLLIFETDKTIRKAPLLENPYINVETCPSLIKKGYREVGDLFNGVGSLFTLKEFQNRARR